MSRFSDLFSSNQLTEEVFSAESVSEGLEITTSNAKNSEIHSHEKVSEERELFNLNSLNENSGHKSYKKMKSTWTP